MKTLLSEYEDNDVLVLSSDWHLRPNLGGGVLYKYSQAESSYHELPAFETIALALFDGRTRLCEIPDLLTEILSLGTKEARRVVQTLLDLNGQNGAFLRPLRLATGSFTRVNVLRIMRDVAAYTPAVLQVKRLQVPLSLVAIPSYRCQTDCIYCYSQRPDMPRKAYLSPDRWAEILTEIGEQGVDLLTFSGGDPLTYRGIERLIEVAVRYQMNFVLPTKAAVTRSRARRLAGFLPNFGTIQVSVDSFDPRVAASMTRVADYAARARASISNLIAAGIRVQTNTVVTSLNFPQLESFIRELRNLGVSSSGFTNYYRTHYRHNDELFLTEEQVNFLNATVARLKNELNWPDLRSSAGVRDYSVPGKNSVEAWKQRSSCSGGTSSCAVLPNGDVVLCEQVPHDSRFVVGNVARRSLLEVWNSRKLLDFIVPRRQLFNGTPCRSCEEFDPCHRVYGRCFRDAYFNFGRIHAPSPNCPQASPGLRQA